MQFVYLMLVFSVYFSCVPLHGVFLNSGFLVPIYNYILFTKRIFLLKNDAQHSNLSLDIRYDKLRRNGVLYLNFHSSNTDLKVIAQGNYDELVACAKDIKQKCAFSSSDVIDKPKIDTVISAIKGSIDRNLDVTRGNTHNIVHSKLSHLFKNFDFSTLDHGKNKPRTEEL